MKRLCATVLIMEAIVVGLSIPVAVQIDHLAPHAAGLTGGIAAVAAVVFAALARRLLPGHARRRQRAPGVRHCVRRRWCL